MDYKRRSVYGGLNIEQGTLNIQRRTFRFRSTGGLVPP
jgi:hypothetical protein